MEAYDNLWVCVDCLVFIANGELPEDDGARAAVLAGVEREAVAGGHWAVTGEDDDREFSWHACACCGSDLGGSRHRCAVLYPNGPIEAVQS